MISNADFKKIDSSLAVIGVVFGILISLLYLVSPTIHLFSIGMALTLSCSLYLFISHAKLPAHEHHNISKNEKKFLDILFLLLFVLSLIILHNSDYRPLSYFLIYSFCVGIVAISIFFSTNKLDYLIQYSKIILLSFNIKYSIFNLAGFVPGIDPWVHAKMNELLSQSGNIEVLFDKEMYFPIMHLQVTVMEILSNVSLRDASNFAIIIPFVFISSFVYLVSKDFLGHRIGLFAMLLVNVSDFHTYWGSAPQTTSYGIMLYYLLIYTLVKSYFLNYEPKWVAISIYLSFVLIITHAVSSFIFIITIVGLTVGSLFYNFVYNGRLISNFKSISLISVTMLLQHWFVALYSKDGRPFFDVIVSTLDYYIAGYAEFLNRPETISTFSATLPPFSERFADTFGLFLFLFFGIVGSLLCLSNKYRSQNNFAFIFVLLILFSITFGFPLFGIRNIIPSRWFAFEYFFLSTLASFSIFKLSTYFKSRKFRSIFVAIIFVNISFFMSVGTNSNSDSPMWLEKNTLSATYTLAEVKGAETLSGFGNNFLCDYLFGRSVISQYFSQNCTIFDSSENFDHGNIFIWRSYMEQRPIGYFTLLEGYYKPVVSTIVLGENFHSKLTQYDKIYDNKDLSAYSITCSTV